MIAMCRYFSECAYASIIHNHRKIETNTFFAVAGRWKLVIKKTSVTLCYGHVYEKILETCQ